MDALFGLIWLCVMGKPAMDLLNDWWRERKWERVS